MKLSKINFNRNLRFATDFRSLRAAALQPKHLKPPDKAGNTAAPTTQTKTETATKTAAVNIDSGRSGDVYQCREGKDKTAFKICCRRSLEILNLAARKRNYGGRAARQRIFVNAEMAAKPEQRNENHGRQSDD